MPGECEDNAIHFDQPFFVTLPIERTSSLQNAKEWGYANPRRCTCTLVIADCRNQLCNHITASLLLFSLIDHCDGE
jgi:hypothetical protein